MWINPTTYQIGDTGLECKDFISAWVGKGYYSVFCFCNIMKYLVRAEKKIEMLLQVNEQQHIV